VDEGDSGLPTGAPPLRGSGSTPELESVPRLAIWGPPLLGGMSDRPVREKAMVGGVLNSLACHWHGGQNPPLLGVEGCILGGEVCEKVAVAS
jgi:hypothetical protein